MFERFKKKSAIHRLLEEQLYEKVAQELANGQRRDGLWAKAIANSNGIDEKVKALYIQYRVQSIKDEIEISKVLDEEAGRQKREIEESKAWDEEAGRQKRAKLETQKKKIERQNRKKSESFTEEEEIIKKIARSCKYGNSIECKKQLETLIEKYPKNYVKLKDKELKDVKGLLVKCHVCDKNAFKDQTRKHMGVRICIDCWSQIKGI